MSITTKASDFKVKEARIERIPERRRWLRGSLEGEHALRPSFAGELVGFLARLSRPLGRHSDRAAVKPVAGFGAHGERMRRADRAGQDATPCGVGKIPAQEAVKAKAGPPKPGPAGKALCVAGGGWLRSARRLG
jgi:hypothetical protein